MNYEACIKRCLTHSQPPLRRQVPSTRAQAPSPSTHTHGPDRSRKVEGGGSHIHTYTHIYTTYFRNVCGGSVSAVFVIILEVLHTACASADQTTIA